MDHINKIETFVLLATLDSLEIADKISAAFEDIGIPILLEHSKNPEDNRDELRISTQSNYAENAKRIIDNILNSCQTTQFVTTKTLSA